jgi:hypothetical protein
LFCFTENIPKSITFDLSSSNHPKTTKTKIVANDAYIILLDAKKNVFDEILVEISIQVFSFWIREKSSLLR